MRAVQSTATDEKKEKEVDRLNYAEEAGWAGGQEGSPLKSGFGWGASSA